MKVLKNRDYIENGTISASEKHFVGECDYHAHEFFEMEFILGGDGVYEIDGEAYRAKSGDLFLLTPLRVHAVSDADLQLVNVMFMLDGDASSEMTAWLFDAPPVLHAAGEDAAFLRALFSEIVRVEAVAPRDATELLQCAVAKACRMSGGVGKKQASPYIREALLLLHEGFSGEMTLISVAARVGLSPAYFSDLFHRETGVAFKTYLDNLRLSYAAKLLAYTAFSVEEICSRVGFFDYANFSKRFKRHYGVSATEFRKRSKKPQKM